MGKLYTTTELQYNQQQKKNKKVKAAHLNRWIQRSPKRRGSALNEAVT